MEGRVMLKCGDCGRTREISGEIPGEYSACFARAVEEEGWAPRPGAKPAFICGACLVNYSGHETVDDEEKILGRADPTSV
jgi:hypothetical protein